MRFTCFERRESPLIREKETLLKRETLKGKLCLELRGRDLLHLKVLHPVN